MKKVRLLNIPALFLTSLREIFQDKKAKSVLYKPLLIGFLCFLVTLPLAWWGLNGIFEISRSAIPNWLPDFLNSTYFWITNSLLGLLRVLLAVLGATISATLIAVLFSSFALESFIEAGALKFELLSADEAEKAKSIQTVLKQALGGMVGSVIFLTIMLFTLALGWIAILAPFAAGLLFFLAGWELVSVPLQLTPISAIQRWKMISSHPLQVLLLGATLTLLLCIPILGLVFVPAGYYVAIKIAAQWRKERTPLLGE